MSLCIFRQIRISSAIDDGRELPEGLRRHVGSCPRCGSFFAQSRAIAGRLEGSAPVAQSPPWMHAKIMARLRDAGEPARQRPARPAWLPAAAGVAAIAIVIGLIVSTAPDRADPEFDTATVQIPTPVTPLHPASVPGRFEERAKLALSAEFQNLASDISGARKFLSASLRNTIPAMSGE